MLGKPRPMKLNGYNLFAEVKQCGQHFEGSVTLSEMVLEQAIAPNAERKTSEKDAASYDPLAGARSKKSILAGKPTFCRQSNRSK